MSIEHSNAMPEIHPDAMAALHKHATNAAAYVVLISLNRRQEAHHHNYLCEQALDELEALGAIDEQGDFSLTSAEDRVITAFYTDELARLQTQAREAAE